VITRNDVIDAITMLTGNDSSKTPQPSELAIRAWCDYFADHPGWTGDDLAVIVHEYCKHPRERIVQPADLGTLIVAFHRDAYQRADPDTRDDAWHDLGGNTPTPRRDRYGHIDNSSEDIDYPREWTPQQRVAAYWEMVDAKHGRRPRTTRKRPEPSDPIKPSRTTSRLDAARAALRTCRGEQECRPAINEYLAALTESREGSA
jgi:hypothetical protein